MNSKTKNKKKALKIALMVLAVLGICCGLSTCATWMLTPTGIVIEMTAAPTRTFVPEPTEIIPTKALEEFPTEVPTQEVDEVGNYGKALAPLLLQHAEAFGSASELMGSYSVNEDLTGFDSLWKAELYSILDEVLVAGSQIRDLVPPPCYSEAHELLIESVDHIDLGIGFLVAGVEAFDPDLINQATEEWTLAGMILEEAWEEMDFVTTDLEAGGSCE